MALFEDEGYENFLPITYTRPVFECRSGMFSFLERAQRFYPESEFLLFARDYLVPTLRKRVSCCVNEPDAVDDDVLLINGTLALDNEAKQLVEKKLAKRALITQKGRLVLARLREDIAKNLAEQLCSPLKETTLKNLMKQYETLEASNLPLLTYPWDLVNRNAELIRKDYAALGKIESEGTVDEQATIYGGEKDVCVGKGAHVEAHVTLDARDGPIFIGNETIVHSGSRISGPTHIGDKTVIPSGLIREGCSIGPVCRVGGELEETTIQGYTNKYHTG
ncbi:MAG: putative sugar nucleotidyl transferase, partial [Candidatus Bathyarchaeota archaeon]|nr:putative sugar nucleotidyl transferase [Candidatus Bathyarchaeota archaeon]